MMSISGLGDFHCRSTMWNSKFPPPSSWEAQEDPAMEMVLNQADTIWPQFPEIKGSLKSPFLVIQSSESWGLWSAIQMFIFPTELTYDADSG